jgi:enediyne biosynthesis protein E5
MGIKGIREVDARLFQIGFLTSMLTLGVLLRDFPIGAAAMVVAIGSCLLTQVVAVYWKQLPWSSLLSASISGISLCLLCRSNSLPLLAFAGVLAISSKWVFTWKGKHFFNPTNFGIVALILMTDSVWVSPAQWGEELILVFWLAIAGVTVVHSAWRYDISVAFLGVFIALLAGRVLYLGQPWAVFWHQLNSGSLILFTFFMISDPRSTPDHRIGRMVFAFAVAGLAYIIRFHFYNPQALLLALFFLSPITVILDTYWKGKRFSWANRIGNWRWQNETNATIGSSIAAHR